MEEGGAGKLLQMRADRRGTGLSETKHPKDSGKACLAVAGKILGSACAKRRCMVYLSTRGFIE